MVLVQVPLERQLNASEPLVEIEDCAQAKYSFGLLYFEGQK